MRSILALFLALLILAAEAPGFFSETPVCAAVDGREAGGQAANASGPATAKSCCGTASCPMHAKGCGAVAACPMAAAREQAASPARARAGTSGPRLRAPSCGREGARTVPGVPDPGTLGAPCATTTPLATAGQVRLMPRDHPTRNLVPADPPPRA